MSKYMVVINRWDPDNDSDFPVYIRQEALFPPTWDDVLQTVCDCYASPCSCQVYKLAGTIYKPIQIQ